MATFVHDPDCDTITRWGARDQDVIPCTCKVRQKMRREAAAAKATKLRGRTARIKGTRISEGCFWTPPSYFEGKDNG